MIQPHTDRAVPAIKLLYTPVEAAQCLGVSRSTLYVLLAQGAIRSVRIGTSRRITLDALTDYVAHISTTPSGTGSDTVDPYRSSGPAGDAASDV
jgi:excisionase family DNA binding protein